MTRNKKIIIGVAIVLALAILSILYLFSIQGISKYFWKGYKNEKLGYEMKYPPTWSIAEERENFGIELSRIVFQSKDYKLKESEEYKEKVEAEEEVGLLQPMVMAGGVKLELLITQVPVDFKWRDWAERATDYPYGKLVSEEFLTLGEKEIYGRQVESGEVASIVVSFPDLEETKLFELILHTLKKDKEKNLEIFKQILSTLSSTEDIKYLRTPEIKLIPPDFFTPSFNEEDKIEFKAQEEQIELSEYSNPQLGFSIRIPKEVNGLYKCPSKETIQVPVKVFEDNENGVVYISQEYYYKAEWDSELGEYTGPCEKISYSLASLRSGTAESYSGKPFLGWAVLIRDIKDEGELDEFIKENYGAGCSAGNKQPWEQQDGVYEISVSADGTDLGNTTCPIGWMNRIKVLYAPEKNKLMSVILGQECTFLEPRQEPHQCYDEEMINGFRFE